MMKEKDWWQFYFQLIKMEGNCSHKKHAPTALWIMILLSTTISLVPFWWVTEIINQDYLNDMAFISAQWFILSVKILVATLSLWLSISYSFRRQISGDTCTNLSAKLTLRCSPKVIISLLSQSYTKLIQLWAIVTEIFNYPDWTNG